MEEPERDEPQDEKRDEDEPREPKHEEGPWAKTSSGDADEITES